jgi:hypothetical protein
MTYNNAREYCKTGTNAWNGTLVAWRDYETQLAVEQYFFVGVARLPDAWIASSSPSTGGPPSRGPRGDQLVP